MGRYIYALGTFDGVHLGHQALITVAEELGAEKGADTAVYTFADLPQKTVEQTAVGMLTTTPQKISLLDKAGAKRVIAEPFEKVRALSPEQFIYYLVGAFGAAGFVCGRDFRFGKGGKGDAATLKQICKSIGKSCRVAEFLTDARGEKISSRRIRHYVEQGEMEAAAAALGRPLFVEGQVLHGKGLAHQWGTPTINLPLPEALARPRFGVYETRVTVEDKVYRGITNVGVRPTFADGQSPNVETFILEGSFENIPAAKVEFLRFIRPERPFADEKSLQLQIAKDIQTLENM